MQICRSLKNMSCFFFDRTRLILKIIFIIDYSASFSWLIVKSIKCPESLSQFKVYFETSKLSWNIKCYFLKTCMILLMRKGNYKYPLEGGRESRLQGILLCMYLWHYMVLGGMWILEDTWGYGSTLGESSSFSLKRYLIKTQCDELGGWLRTLIGLEPDIMYGLCPSTRTNDDYSVVSLGSWLCV